MRATVKNNNKEKWVYSGYGIAFDGKGEWSLGDDYAKTVVFFCTDFLSSSPRIDNPKNKFLVFGEEDTFGINGNFGVSEKKFSITFSKANTIFCLSLHYTGDNSYLLGNRTEIYKFKVTHRNVNFPTWFCIGSIYDRFHDNQSRDVSLGGNVYC